MPSDRVIRARHFAYSVMSMVRQYVPEACESEMLEELMINAYGHDIEIAQVPPERDVIKKAAIDAALLGVGIARIVPGEFFTKPDASKTTEAT